MKPVALVLMTVLFVPTALAQAPPTPMKPIQRPAYDPNTPKPQPVVRYRASSGVIGGWQRFQGATRCEQIGNALTCDNGYKQTVR